MVTDEQLESDHVGGNVGSKGIRESSPANPLVVPEAMTFPLGTHYFRIPDPRGADILLLRYQTSNPEIGRSMVVEMKVQKGKSPFFRRWAFRYTWAKWSLIVDLGKSECWHLAVETAGPRTEMQVRALYELANKLHFNATVEFLKRKWPQVKQQVLPHGAPRAPLGPAAAKQKSEELEDRAILNLKLLAARAQRTWHKRADSETTILQAFLQGRTSPSLICEIFDLKWQTAEPFLLGLQDAYDRLISEALAHRCRAVRSAYQKKKLTLEEAAAILHLDTPVGEDILRISSAVERKFTPAKVPSKDQLLKAIHAIETLRLVTRGETRPQGSVV